MTTEQLLELKKCCDPIHGAAFFISNYIKPPYGNKFNLWTNQYQFLNDMNCDRDLIYVKARQTGFSTITNYYILWKLMFSADKSNIALLTNYHTIGVATLNFIKNTHDALPDWIKEAIPIDRCTANQITIRDNSLLHSDYKGYERLIRGTYFNMTVLEDATTLDFSDYNFIWHNAKIRYGLTGGSKVIASMGIPTSDLKDVIDKPMLTHFVRHWDWWTNPNHDVSRYMRLKNDLPTWMFESEIAV